MDRLPRVRFDPGLRVLNVVLAVVFREGGQDGGTLPDQGSAYW